MRKLNPDQIAASAAAGGISLVIAGAGTGKTSTMISKILNVLEHSIVKPEEVLVLTFSRKAADEIRERLYSGYGTGTMSGFAGTFHSFSLKLLTDNKEYYLKKRGYTTFPSVISNDEKYCIMKKLVMEKPERFLGLPADIVIKLLENLAHLKQPVIDKLKSGPLYNEIRNITLQYENYKMINRLIEFEDMINHATDLLESYPDLKKR